MQGMHVFVTFCRKNSSFIPCGRPYRFEPWSHGGGHQFCGKMYCDSGEYLTSSHIITAELSPVLPFYSDSFWEVMFAQIIVSRMHFQILTHLQMSFKLYGSVTCIILIMGLTKWMTWDCKVLCDWYRVSNKHFSIQTNLNPHSPLA